MTRRKLFYRRWLIVITVIATLWLLFFYYLSVRNNIPNKIHIIRGKEQEIKFRIPASGRVAGISNYKGDTQMQQSIPVSYHDSMTFMSEKTGNYKMSCLLFGMIPVKDVSISVVDEKKVIPVGLPIGIYAKADGVLVLETGKFQGMDDVEHNPADQIIKKGDYIHAINGKQVKGKKDLIKRIANCEGNELRLTISRNEEQFDVRVKPVLASDGEYKIGIWVRDNVQGIGTLTYVDENLNFAALGHGINDYDTATLLSIEKGSLYLTNIVAVVRGMDGVPGELVGTIDYSEGNEIGIITNNTEHGIYGQGYEKLMEYMTEQPYVAAMKQEVCKGTAQILCSIDGKKEAYQVEITELDKNMNKESANLGLVVEVTDERLLEKTGGIVQGMSGSPIIQNGKIVGAITHVFVSEPRKGYGIFIEDMLEK